MSWQVNCKHVPVMPGEVTCEQGPYAVIKTSAVDKNDRLSRRINLFIVGVDVDLLSVYRDVHECRSPTTFEAARSPAFRSAMRSLGSSSPIDSRIVPSPMPAARKAASSILKCVVLAG